MKTLMISLLALGSAASIYAQDVLDQTKVKNDELPNVVIGSVKEQMPQVVYNEFQAVPDKNVKNEIVLKNMGDLDDYNSYQVTLEGKHKKIMETYDNKGNLTEVREIAKDEKLPDDIVSSITKSYPGWAISDDVYRLNRFADNMEEESYKVTLEKGNKKMRVSFDASGGILKEPLTAVEII